MGVDGFSLFFALLTVAADVGVLAVVGLWLAARRHAGARLRFEALRDAVAPTATALAWLVAATATAGSLYFSEVAGFPPCDLCWYQRIAMYPLVVVLGVAAWRRHASVRTEVIPLTLAGAAISTYHYQLERFPSQQSLSCALDVPCTTVWVWRFHFISIPFMALSAFLAIAVLMALARPVGQEVPA
jgi:disulfide bond formation protein DsbB